MITFNPTDCTENKTILESDDKFKGTSNERDSEVKCLNKSCPECGGTGRKRVNGQMCVHYISCPCPKCTIYC